MVSHARNRHSFPASRATSGKDFSCPGARMNEEFLSCCRGIITLSDGCCSSARSLSCSLLSFGQNETVGLVKVVGVILSPAGLDSPGLVRSCGYWPVGGWSVQGTG